jgi:putative inorganic carbon (hco3(-)) transporter
MNLKIIVRNLLFGLIIFSIVAISNLVIDIHINLLLLLIVLSVFWFLMLVWIRPYTFATIIFAGLMQIKPSEAIFYLSIFLFIISFLLDRFKPNGLKIKIPFPALLLILLFAGIQAIWRAVSFSDGLPYFFSTIIIPIMLLISIFNIPYRKEYIDYWTLTIVGIGFFLALVGIVMAIQNPLMRLGSLWITAMTINGFYIMAIFFAIAWAIRVKTIPYKVLFYIATLVIFIGMVDTYTRMALLTFVFGLMILMFSVKNLRYLGIVCILIVPLLIPSGMVTRINAGTSSDVSIIIRLIAWSVAIKQIGLHLFWGIGFDSWKFLYSKWVPVEMLYAQHPHNLYIRIFLETGIFGFIAYFAIIFNILYLHMKYTYKRNEQSFNFTIYVAMLSLLFACLSDIFIQQYNIVFPAWITLALLYQQALNNKKEVLESIPTDIILT